jgi:hypothetical protein
MTRLKNWKIARWLQVDRRIKCELATCGLCAFATLQRRRRPVELVCCTIRRIGWPLANAREHVAVWRHEAQARSIHTRAWGYRRGRWVVWMWLASGGRWKMGGRRSRQVVHARCETQTGLVLICSPVLVEYIDMFCGIRIIRMCGWPGLAIFFFVMLRIYNFVCVDW